MKCWRLLLAPILALWLGAGWCAPAMTVRVVADVQSAPAQGLVEILQLRLAAADSSLQSEVVLPTKWQSPPARSLVITVGREAWKAVAASPPSDSVWLALSPPRRELESLRRRGVAVHGLLFDQPPARFLSLARLAFPDRRAIGLLVAAETEDVLPELERAAATQGQNLLVERIEAGQDVGRATERLAQQSDLLLAWPDARVHNRFTVQPLLLVTYRARVPVIGYSDAYLKAGAVLALYSTPEQLAEQAVDSLLALRLGRTLPGIQWPRQFTVGVNFSVARSLEITLPSASQLQQRLKESGS